MIQLLSRLEVADNTGAKKVRMIRRIGQNKKTASVGDIIVCHVKESSTEASVKKGTVVRAVVVRTKSPLYKKEIRRKTTVHVHDEKNDSNVGDKVRIMATRPLSKLKRWRITEVLEKAPTL